MAGKIYCAAGDFRQSEVAVRRALTVVVEHHRQTYGTADSVIESQRAFESYRDGYCLSIHRRIEDQPFHAMVVDQCRTRRNGQRANELDAMRVKAR